MNAMRTKTLCAALLFTSLLAFAEAAGAAVTYQGDR
jgi:hypothetical protein